ncbi:hypothetical protein CsatB_012554 [Cannabis sativa]
MNFVAKRLGPVNLSVKSTSNPAFFYSHIAKIEILCYGFQFLTPGHSPLKIKVRKPSMEATQIEKDVLEKLPNSEVATSEILQQPLSKNAQKKLLKQQKYEAKKAEKKAQAKEQKKKDGERKRKEWEEMLASLPEEERSKLIESRKSMRKERMDKRSEERESKIERLTKAKLCGQNIIIDMEFSHLMTPSEINSLVQQIMYCYAVNGRCTNPGHLWLTGCAGEVGTQLQRLPGFDKWIIEKDNRPYIEALQDQKEHLVYLTADSETVLDELDPKKMYIVGGLVDRNRWKGITMKKAQEQGIQTAKLPIGNYLKMASSQVLTVNQVIEILIKFLETKDWKDSFFQVIPQRKICEADKEEEQHHELVNLESDQCIEKEEEEHHELVNLESLEQVDAKRQCVEKEEEQHHELVNLESLEQVDAKRQCVEKEEEQHHELVNLENHDLVDSKRPCIEKLP